MSHKTIWHIPNITNSEFKLKKSQVFPKLLLFFIYSLARLNINSETSPPPPIINVACKYLRQVLGTRFGVATLPICCKIE